jgi:hypothetical protein
MFFKTESWWWKTGLILSIIHFLFVGFLVVDIGMGGTGGQWQFAWIVPDYLDFPVSSLMWQIRSFMPDSYFYYDFDDFYSFPPEPVGDLRDFIVPSVFYLLIGTAWYLYLPLLIAKVAKKMVIDRVGYLCIVFLFIIPLFSKWVELIWLYIDGLPPFLPFATYGTLCLLWAGFFVWLCLGHARKVRAIWLLCLSIFIFYQFFKEMYIYFKFIL